MSRFHQLKVVEIKRETPDSVSVAFEVPQNLANDFKYKQGQYLTFRFVNNGEELRRSYSLCSSPFVNEKLRVAVKEVAGGKISTHFNRNLKVGDVIESMAPMGNFFTELKSTNAKKYCGFAAGSGITPLFSIIKSVLALESGSTFTLIYSNKGKDSIIFGAELDALVQSSNGRLNVIHVWSREDTGKALLNGRLTKEKISQLIAEYKLASFDEHFICGPEEMILNINEALKANAVAKEKIHYELFTTPVLIKQENATSVQDTFDGTAEVTVIMDGISTQFKLSGKGDSVLDAAINAGADAPYSCKGAVCCTCKAKIIEGKADMEMNYSLSDKEVAEGFILTCQAHPRSSKLVVDYDVV